MDAIVPPSIREQAPIPLPGPMTEAAALAKLKAIAARNRVMKSYIGQGYYGTHTPGVILRNILENPAWYTAYTPYQPEISQGRLEALVNFQTMVCDLDRHGDRQRVDARRSHRRGRGDDARAAHGQERRAAASSSPTTCSRRRSTSCARARSRSASRWSSGPADDGGGGRRVRASLLQYPGRQRRRARLPRARVAAACARCARDRRRRPPRAHAARLARRMGRRRRRRARRSASACRWATAARTRASSPRATSSSARCRDASSASPSMRTAIPRIGSRCRRASSTSAARRRRRTSARRRCCSRSSRACTPCITVPEGLTRIARRVHRLTAILRAGPRAARLRRAAPTRTSTRIVVATARATARDRRARRRRRASTSAASSEATLGISLDETTTREDVEAIWRIVRRRAPRRSPSTTSTPRSATRLPAAARASTPFLTHPVFHRYRSETEMLRYLRRLADRDLALDRAMIPLGSCTMKLNATSEMIPGDVARVRRAASVRARRPGRGLSRDDRASSSRCSARSPATTPCRCSPTRDRRASTRAC